MAWPVTVLSAAIPASVEGNCTPGAIARLSDDYSVVSWHRENFPGSSADDQLVAAVLNTTTDTISAGASFVYAASSGLSIVDRALARVSDTRCLVALTYSAFGGVWYAGCLDRSGTTLTNPGGLTVESVQTGAVVLAVLTTTSALAWRSLAPAGSTGVKLLTWTSGGVVTIASCATPYTTGAAHAQAAIAVNSTDALVVYGVPGSSTNQDGDFYAVVVRRVGSDITAGTPILLSAISGFWGPTSLDAKPDGRFLASMTTTSGIVVSRFWTLAVSGLTVSLVRTDTPTPMSRSGALLRDGAGYLGPYGAVGGYLDERTVRAYALSPSGAVSDSGDLSGAVTFLTGAGPSCAVRTNRALITSRTFTGEDNIATLVSMDDLPWTEGWTVGAA